MCFHFTKEETKIQREYVTQRSKFSLEVLSRPLGWEKRVQAVASSLGPSPSPVPCPSHCTALWWGVGVGVGLASAPLLAGSLP